MPVLPRINRCKLLVFDPGELYCAGSSEAAGCCTAVYSPLASASTNINGGTTMLFRIAQVAMAISFYWTFLSLYHTWGHGFSDEFFGVLYSSHAQFHAIREVFFALGIVLMVGIFMYGPKSMRTPLAWWSMLIDSTCLTVGVWLAMLITDNQFPNLDASMNHIMNTLFAAVALALSWKSYRTNQNPA